METAPSSSDFERGAQALHRVGLEPPSLPESLAQSFWLDAGSDAERIQVKAGQNGRIETAAEDRDVGQILELFIACVLNVRVYQRIGFFPDIFMVEDHQF